ncbi:MAG: inositol monophosphatase family protein [Rhodospirillaceae bacterium]|nr:inositol monophosphatase family protein [Rhodospirillaceae bacterium]MDD9913986.1 inositol monophosphatase family protein [Rhodospirillaceae bacterium]MDD9927888.1 inositol monophosphatase family protein [Rhodospirillaceae bacterium]
MALRSAIINVMAMAADKAGRSLVRDFGEVEQLQVSRKGPADFVSSADMRAEKILRNALAQAHPEFGLLMEEGGEIKGSDDRHRWIIDPLDGTTNFLHGLPHFCISVALERDGQVVAGIVYDPVKDELFWAERGLGAYVNDRRLRVSGRGRMREGVFATGIPFLGIQDGPGHQKFLGQLGSVMAECAGVRRFGSAALDLAYVAAGRYDGFWENGLNPWDVAAGVLLVREAGGQVTDIAGRRYELGAADICAGNDQLHQPLRKLLRKMPTRD